MNRIILLLRKATKAAIRALPLPVVLKEKILFVIQMGYWPDFSRPSSFCEKLHRRKLYERDLRLVDMSDKIKVRDFVAATIGAGYLIPLKYAGSELTPELLLGLGDQLVVKRNDDCGSAEVIPEITPEIAAQTCARIRSKTSYGKKTNEWWYELIPSRYLIEERLVDPDQSNGRPLDYKFFVFNKENETSAIVSEVVKRAADGTLECSFFNESMGPLFMNGKQVSYQGCPTFTEEFPEPGLFEEMKSIALSLSKGFDFVRVDLYAVKGKIYFGEMTFNPAEGRFRISPPAFDFELGKQWDQPIALKHIQAA